MDPNIKYSILLQETECGSDNDSTQTPAFFVDLHLDQIVEAVTAGKEDYNLKPIFSRALKNSEAAVYRQEILQDLENTPLFDHIESFARKMREMRERLAQAEKLYYKYQKRSWFLDAVDLYCDTVKCLRDDLSAVELESRGFLAFYDYLTSYAASAPLLDLASETKKLKANLLTVNYCILLKGNAVRVRKCDAEIDYSADVERTFAKFKQGAVKDYRVKLSRTTDMNHVEAQILDGVARLYPEIFRSLDNFQVVHINYLDRTLAVFDQEVQFFVAYLDYTSRFKRQGLKFCYPHLSDTDKEVSGYEVFDLALADSFFDKQSTVVCNDFYLRGDERIFIVSGPNQGGKTTFARTFGQMHYLAKLGLTVPGRAAKLFCFDELFTHFERQENITNLRGKLQDDLVRIHDILKKATSDSIVIMNEIFTSTTLQDAIFLSEKVMEKIRERDLLCVWVTFIDELSSFGEQTVSMVSTIVPENPALRTFKVIRRPADGRSYAVTLAEKYRLTYNFLKERLAS